jgi:hypothetical protein
VPTGTTPSGAIQLLDDGQVILDLYEDENIPLTLSVDDFKNVAEKVQSYSKAFNLPATKRNNQIFENLFELTRSAQNSITFNPYAKTKSVLKQDGFTLFEGYLRVLDIQDKEGEISYNVNLYSEVISLADTLKDKTFSQLDFTELQHDYNKTQIKNSWNDLGTGITYTNSSTSGFRNDFKTVKYPFVDWTHQILIAAPGGTPTAGNPQLVNLEQAFRPFIQIQYLINRIFQDTEFTFESAFFGSTDFKSLYMDFNWGEGNELIYGLAQFISTDTTNSSTTSFTNLMLPTDDSTNSASATGFDVTTGVLTSTANDSVYVIQYDFRLDKDFNATADFQWVHKDSLGNIIDTINVTSIPYTAGSSSLIWSGNLTRVLQNNETLEAQFKTSVSAGLAQNSDNSFVIFTLNPLVITTNTLLQTLRGELGQWEFLKGIMTMFNLISLPDKSNPKNIIIEPYKDIFLPSIVIDSGTGLIAPNFFDDNSTKLDWTNKIDTTEIKLEVLTDLNKTTVFKFVEDDDDYAFNLYKTAVQGHLYGSQVFDASTTTGNLQSVLEGEEEIIAEPFAATVPKPLMSQFSDFITPSIYSYNAEDGTSEGFENSPRIMYNNGVKTLTSCALLYSCSKWII